MESGFTLVHRAGRLIKFRSRGAFTLREAAESAAQVNDACQKIEGPALIVGDVRRARVAGDEIAPVFFDASRESALPIERMALLVDPPASSALQNASSESVGLPPVQRTFQHVSDLLAFVGETASGAERQGIVEFLEGGAPPTNLLVVDDDDELSLILSEFLEEAGYKVRTAPDGVEAMRCLSHYTPDVILMDVIMKRGGGLQTLLDMKDQGVGGGIPVVLMSGHRKFEQGLPEGCRAFLEKPFSYETLLGVLRQTLA